jgi:quercetin dioxygenase-like cupin family protein
VADESQTGFEGQVLQLADLVQYGDGAVVSRTLIKRTTGTLTLFAFDAGQELSEHTAPFDAVVQILDGEALLTIGGNAVTARQHETVIMPANIPHAVKATRKFKMLLTMIRS